MRRKLPPVPAQAFYRETHALAASAAAVETVPDAAPESEKKATPVVEGAEGLKSLSCGVARPLDWEQLRLKRFQTVPVRQKVEPMWRFPLMTVGAWRFISDLEQTIARRSTAPADFADYRV